MIDDQEIKQLLRKARGKGYIKDFRHMVRLIKRIRTLDREGFEILKETVEKARKK